MRHTDISHNRRQFLRFLAASPLLAANAQQNPTIITDPKDALNVMDFEAAARQTVPPAHFGYLSTGVDDEATLRANRDGFNRVQLRPRRLVDVTQATLRTEVFGTTLENPILMAPAASQRAFHPDGELGTARAARAKRNQMILSTASTCSACKTTRISSLARA